MELADIVQRFSVWALPLILAMTWHEAAHAYVAWRLGDDSVYRRGLVTLNPLKHIDPFGTVILPAILLLSGSPFLFGYAQTAVDMRNMRNYRRDLALVAVAGPAMNLALAVISAALLSAWVHVMGDAKGWVTSTLAVSFFFNLLLVVINMLPLPPLDGGRVAIGLLPPVLAIPLARLERWGMFIFLGLFLVLPLLSRELGLPVDVFGLLLVPIQALQHVIASLVGLK